MFKKHYGVDGGPSLGGVKKSILSKNRPYNSTENTGQKGASNDGPYSYEKVSGKRLVAILEEKTNKSSPPSAQSVLT